MNHTQPHSRLQTMTRVGALVATAMLVITPTLRAAGPDAGATGTIKGRLVYTGPVPERKVEVAKDAPNVRDAVCKVEEHLSKDLIVDPTTKGVVDGFAYLIKPAGDYTKTEEEFLAKNPQVVVDQVKCEFVPYASVVHKDQKLIFKSSDPVGHNVDIKSFVNPGMNTMLNANGSVEYKIKKEDKRPTPVICDIHPWMKGFFLVADSPFAVVTKKDGSFEIPNVPAGPQQLVVWQSTKGFVTSGSTKGMTVEVKPGGITDVGELKFGK